MNVKNINEQNRTAAIGVSFDVSNEKEVIAIGSPENLKSYFTMGIVSDEIEVRTRKLGCLVEDMNELAKGRKSGEEKGWLTLEAVEEHLGITHE